MSFFFGRVRARYLGAMGIVTISACAKNEGGGQAPVLAKVEVDAATTDPAPVAAPIAPVAPVASVAPVAPTAPVAPVASPAPVAPVASPAPAIVGAAWMVEFPRANAEPWCKTDMAQCVAQPSAKKAEDCARTLQVACEQERHGPMIGTNEDRQCVGALNASVTRTERPKHKNACCYGMNHRCPHPGEGRLLRTDDTHVVIAESQARDDWAASVRAMPHVRTLDAASRTEVARRWREAAAYEHASVASFARASLHLMALGAPADLVRGSHLAAVDEVTHARLRYGVATACDADPRGPGPLALDALRPSDLTLDRLAMDTFVDAYVNETIAALIAREAAAHVVDPGLREQCARVADDEERHAELAWRILAWAIAQGASKTELRRALAELAEEATLVVVDDRDVVCYRDHGMLSAPARNLIRQRTICEVILPCATAVLG